MLDLKTGRLRKTKAWYKLTANFLYETGGQAVVAHTMVGAQLTSEGKKVIPPACPY